MKNCRHRHAVIEYVDGSLGAEAREAFEQHLEGCADCRRDCIEYRKTLEIMSGDDIRVPEDGYFEVIMKRIKKPAGARRSVSRWFYPAVLAPVAAAVLIVIGAGWLGRSRRTVEIPIDISAFMNDADVSRLVLPKIVDSDLAAQFGELEDYLTAGIDENISEMNETERKEFVEKLNEKYGRI